RDPDGAEAPGSLGAPRVPSSGLWGPRLGCETVVPHAHCEAGTPNPTPSGRRPHQPRRRAPPLTWKRVRGTLLGRLSPELEPGEAGGLRIPGLLTKHSATKRPTKWRHSQHSVSVSGGLPTREKGVRGGGPAGRFAAGRLAARGLRRWVSFSAGSLTSGDQKLRQGATISPRSLSARSRRTALAHFWPAGRHRAFGSLLVRPTQSSSRVRGGRRLPRQD
ncbi:unnamed protein product, partial [Ixodes persulcatus]